MAQQVKDLALVTAVAQVPSLTWEPPHAMRMVQKKKKRQNDHVVEILLAFGNLLIFPYLKMSEFIVKMFSVIC